MKNWCYNIFLLCILIYFFASLFSDEIPIQIRMNWTIFKFDCQPSIDPRDPIWMPLAVEQQLLIVNPTSDGNHSHRHFTHTKYDPGDRITLGTNWSGTASLSTNFYNSEPSKFTKPRRCCKNFFIVIANRVLAIISWRLIFVFVNANSAIGHRRTSPVRQ